MKLPKYYSSYKIQVIDLAIPKKASHEIKACKKSLSVDKQLKMSFVINDLLPEKGITSFVRCWLTKGSEKRAPVYGRY